MYPVCFQNEKSTHVYTQGFLARTLLMRGIIAGIRPLADRGLTFIPFGLRLSVKDILVAIIVNPS